MTQDKDRPTAFHTSVKQAAFVSRPVISWPPPTSQILMLEGNPIPVFSPQHFIWLRGGDRTVSPLKLKTIFKKVTFQSVCVTVGHMRPGHVWSQRSPSAVVLVSLWLDTCECTADHRLGRPSTAGNSLCLCRHRSAGMAGTPFLPRQAYMGLRDPNSALPLSWQVLPATFLTYKKYILKFAKQVL